MEISGKDVVNILARTFGVVGLVLVFYFLITLSTFTLLFLIITLALVIVDMIRKKLTKKKHSLVDVLFGGVLAFIIALVLYVLNINLTTGVSSWDWVSLLIFAGVSLTLVFVFELLNKLRG